MVSGALIAVGALPTFMGGGLIALFLYFTTRQGELGVPNLTGNPTGTMIVFGIFGLILLFGIMAMAMGVYQVIYGRAHKGLLKLFLLSLAALVGIALFIKVAAMIFG